MATLNLGREVIAGAEAISTMTPLAEGLVARIREIQAEIEAHPGAIDKTKQGAMVRVARILNKEGQFPCSAHSYWTWGHVLLALDRGDR